jgi:hypothetical protein
MLCDVQQTWNVIHATVRLSTEQTSLQRDSRISSSIFIDMMQNSLILQKQKLHHEGVVRDPRPPEHPHLVCTPKYESRIKMPQKFHADQLTDILCLLT